MFEHPFCASPDMVQGGGEVSSENFSASGHGAYGIKTTATKFFNQKEQSVSGQLCMHHLAVWVTCIYFQNFNYIKRLRA